MNRLRFLLAFILCCNLGFSQDILARNISSSTLSVMMDSQHHEYVDLGLPSGTLWATCNIGASVPEENGLFFAWGDVEGHNRDYRFPHEEYKWSEGKGHMFVNKYTFADKRTYGCWYKDGIYVGTVVDGVTYKNLTNLLPEDDAAMAIWGKEWCMPTVDQISELCDKRNTVIKLVKANGVMGYLVRSKRNKKTLFFPTRGSIPYLEDVPEQGAYWSCSLCTDDSSCASILKFSSDRVYVDEYLRFYGLMIRPVRNTRGQAHEKRSITQE